MRCCETLLLQVLVVLAAEALEERIGGRFIRRIVLDVVGVFVVIGVVVETGAGRPMR